jgi:hypothetical protein
MNEDEQQTFEYVLDALDIPAPDKTTKEKIMKAVYFLTVAKEVGAFNASIPITLFYNSTSE